jgi:hypothetical protein
VTANALRWNGSPGWYEVWYVVVAGRLWLRHTLHVPAERTRPGEAAVWLAAWLGPPTARKWTFPLDAFQAEPGGGRLEIAGARLDAAGASGAPEQGVAWELSFAGGGRPFQHPHRLVRPARTRVELSAPALEISGWLELGGQRHELDHAPGHQAHVFGTRHAESFAWAHATTGDGRWLDLLAAKLPRLPLVAAYATERRAVNAPWQLPFVRADLSPERSRIGPYAVAAAREDFVGVTYHDPDGGRLFCYHTERARVSGPGLETGDVAYEFATRTALDGWTISL